MIRQVELPPSWTRRVDVLLVSKAERIAVEVKVTRSDFLADVKDPSKQAPWRALAHRHAFAVPAGLVTVTEVPADSGLLSVGGLRPFGADVEWTRRAPKGNDPADLPAKVVHAIMHRLARAEATAKGLVGNHTDPEAMRLEIERLRADLDLANGREDAARRRASAFQAALALRGYPPCATCERPVKPKYGRRLGMEWQHANPADEELCATVRAGNYAAENSWQSEVDPRFRHVPPVEPADDPEAQCSPDV